LRKMLRPEERLLPEDALFTAMTPADLLGVFAALVTAIIFSAVVFFAEFVVVTCQKWSKAKAGGKKIAKWVDANIAFHNQQNIKF